MFRLNLGKVREQEVGRRGGALTMLQCLLLLNTGCSAVTQPLKAGPGPLSPFVEAHRELPVEDSSSPFHRVWWRTGSIRSSGKLPKVVIMPVELKYLRSSAWWYSSDESARLALQDDAKKLGEYMRKQFALHLLKQGVEVTGDRSEPGARVLHLAIVELHPTDIYRKAAATAASFVVPGGSVLGLGSGGSLAIEGKLLDNSSGEPLFIFADRERAKIAPFSFNDFTYFSHARDIIDDWAEQFADTCTKPKGTAVKDSLPFTLSLL